MNLYRYPSEKAEIVLANAWAKSARAEGHFKRLPSMSPSGVSGIAYTVTDTDRAAVLSAVMMGNIRHSEIAKCCGFGRMVTAATLTDLVASGRLTAKKVRVDGRPPVQIYSMGALTGGAA